MAEKQMKQTLTSKEMENIQKMPTARIIRKLSDIGFTEEQLELMEREDLLRAWISVVSEGRDIPVPSGEPPRAIILDPTIAEKQLEFERFRLQQEMQFRQQQQAILKLRVGKKNSNGKKNKNQLGSRKLRKIENFKLANLRNKHVQQHAS